MISLLKFHKISQIKLESKVGTSIREALKEALQISKEFNCQIVIIWSDNSYYLCKIEKINSKGEEDV